MIVNITSDDVYAEVTKKAGPLVNVFWASWCEECKHIDAVIETLSTDHPGTTFARVEAEAFPDISEHNGVTCVPCITIVKNRKLVGRVDGADVPVMVALVNEHCMSSNKPAAAAAPAGGAPAQVDAPQEETVEQTRARIDKIVKLAPIVVFMKGVPNDPKCGFSRKIVDLLNKHGAPFVGYNILEDPAVRAEIKTYKNFPTFPQIYSQGELVGGLDIAQELDAEGELKEVLQVATKVPEKEDINVRLGKLVSRSKVMLFMKGNPAQPQCGFSNKIVGLLNDTGVKYDTFDILSDADVRSGLKEYSNWPTFPQLYVNGKLIGGLDIVKEMADEGELLDALQA